MKTPAIYRFSTLLLFISICFTSSCSEGDLVSYIRDFQDEIAERQNLEFTFDRDVCPDSLLNNWDSSEYFKITPAVKGMFKWTGTRTLLFSPAEGFSPGTSYQAIAQKQILKYVKGNYQIDAKPILFHTAPLSVFTTQASWKRADNMVDVISEVGIGFNYNVNYSEAVKHVRITQSGKPIPILTSNNGTGHDLTLDLKIQSEEDEATAIEVKIAKGISVIGSDYVSERDTTFTVLVPSRFNLSISNLSAQHTGTEGIITMSTSQPVLEQNLKKCITFEPAVPFNVQVSNNSIIVTSEKFSPTQIYQVQVSTGIEGAFGGKLKQQYSGSASFGEMIPAISFNNTKGTYISSQGYKNIDLSIVNVPTIEVSVVKVYENNIEHFLENDMDYDYHWDDEADEGNSYEYYNTANLGDVIFSKTYETNKLPFQNAARQLHLDFEDKIKEYNGLYVIKVKSKDHYWIQKSKILAISDIGLIVKEGKNNVYAFANSIKNATPMEGVKVSFISSTNQKLFTATTNADGVATFDKTDATARGFHTALVTAKKDAEFSYIAFNKSRIGTSRFDIGGRLPGTTGLIAMIYAERNLYRPGETVHLSTIVRDEQWQTQADIPVKIKFVMPNGKEFATARKTLNKQGSCEATFAPPPEAMTGTYIAEVYTGNDVLLNSYNIVIEEFMPDRLKAVLKNDKEVYKPGDKIQTSIQADNLYGTPAANRNYECAFSLTKAVFSSDKYADYSFDLSNDVRVGEELRKGMTNEQGAASEQFDIDTSLAGAGLLTGKITGTVFDETGRPMHRYANFKVFTQPVFAGIRCDDRYVSSKKPVKVGLIALDQEGAIVQSEVEVVVIKKHWYSVIQRLGGSYRYVSQSDDRVISRQKVKVSGAGSHFTFVVPGSGDYEVRVFAPGSRGYVSRRIYAYGWGDTQYSSFEVNNEGNVTIKTDKKSYNKGEDINALFTTPFDGRMLVTIEQDGIIEHRYVNTENKSASLSFKTDAGYLPNVYITATLFRPMDGSDMPLTVAHGFASVTVQDKQRAMEVSIKSVEQSRSHKTQTINVTAAPGAFVTIAAVDEGILQIKNFVTPDPYGFFYQKTALSVRSYDIYPWLLPEVKSYYSSTGGDGGGYDGSRVNPMFVNRVKNVSYWSGIRQADNNGNIKYEIDIPQFSGDIRIMALAYKDNAFGSNEAHIKVADPIVTSVALPRFLSPGDEVNMAVSLSNTTKRDAEASITVNTAGKLSVNGSTTRNVTIPAGKEQRIVFPVTASNAIGKGNVTVKVDAFNEVFTNETDISIRPPASLQKITGNGYAAPNKSASIAIAENFLPVSFSGKLTISKSPLTQFAKHLDDLVRYPYGCVEQTTSAAFPQLYYSDMVKSITGFATADENPTANVQKAITKLQSMQSGNGGLYYWPTGGHISWWGSTYACHFLLEARKAGFEVNARTIERLLDYLKYKLYKKEIVSYRYNGNKIKNVAPSEVPYSLYVLALAGQPQPSEMNYYKAHSDLLTLSGKYLLSAAYAMSGMKVQSKEILPASYSGEQAERCLDGSFNSYIRDMALSLSVMMDTDPYNKQTGTIAKLLSDQVQQERYMNTQEKAFSILALGKVARLSNKTDATATVTANGKTIGSSDGKSVTIDLKGNAGNTIGINVKGKGGFYYFWETSGISADGSIKQEDKFIKVRRTYLTRNGITAGNTFDLNDLIVVHITLESLTGKEVSNVVVTDMLPAGFEIENSRLNNLPSMSWIKKKSTADYVDIRDDRINIFTSANGKVQDFYYMVRAVSPGRFVLGPIQADAMYDGNYHSYNGAGKIIIKE